jgi:hypothetical protein
MKLALPFCAVVALTLVVVQPSFAGVIPQVYTFSFTANANSVYPSFSFTETFPDFITTDGPLNIAPIAMPGGFTLTKGQSCHTSGAFSFEFGTAGTTLDSDCSIGFSPGSNIDAIFTLSSGYPTTDGVYSAGCCAVTGNPGISSAGPATVTITATPEPASWILLSSALFTAGLWAKRKRLV